MPETDARTLTTEGGDQCPVCYAKAPRAAALPEFQLFACEACGCWSSDALVREADVSFETTDYFSNADLDRGKWEELFARLQSEDRSIESVLDVGCGTGAYLAYVAEVIPGCHREGIEIDPGRAREARERNPGVEIHEGDASETLSERAGSFDLITLWDVFEHVTAPAELLKQLATRLSPNGIIHIVTINERSLMPMLGRMGYAVSRGRVTYPLRRTHEPHHLVFFTSPGLDIAAERAGLQIRDLWYDRLLRGRMDGHPIVTAVASALLWLENALGNGLFVNLILEAKPASGGEV